MTVPFRRRYPDGENLANLSSPSLRVFSDEKQSKRMAVTIKKIGLFALIVATSSLVACKEDAPSVVQGAHKNTASTAEEHCYTESPYLAVGAGIDAPGNRLEVDIPPVGQAAICSNNNQFRFGSGITDITGVVANTSGFGKEDPAQVLGGIHQC